MDALIPRMGFGEMSFGTIQLGDRRRTRRLVQAADRILQHPMWDLAGQAQLSGRTEGTVPFGGPGSSDPRGPLPDHAKVRQSLSRLFSEFLGPLPMPRRRISDPRFLAPLTERERALTELGYAAVAVTGARPDERGTIAQGCVAVEAGASVTAG